MYEDGKYNTEADRKQIIYYENMPMQYTEILFQLQKLKISPDKF